MWTWLLCTLLHCAMGWCYFGAQDWDVLLAAILAPCLAFRDGKDPTFPEGQRPTRTRTHTHDTRCKALLLAINPLPQGAKRKNPLRTCWFCKGMLVSPSSLTTLYKLEAFSMTVYSASLFDELHCALLLWILFANFLERDCTFPTTGIT